MSSGQFFDGHASKEELAPSGGSALHQVKSVGVLIVGVGNMGGGMVANLLSKGWQVMVSDLDAKKVDFWVSKGATDQSLHRQAAPDLIATIICVVDALPADWLNAAFTPLTRPCLAGQRGRLTEP